MASLRNVKIYGNLNSAKEWPLTINKETNSKRCAYAANRLVFLFELVKNTPLIWYGDKENKNLHDMKKKIPLTILESLEPLLNSNSNFIELRTEEDSMICLIDKDVKSDFYFRIVRQENREQRLGYTVEFKPRTSEDMTKNKTWLQIDGVISSINKWLKILEAYDRVKIKVEDPIIVANQAYFADKYKLVDEDADKVTFNLEQTLFLEEYLSSIPIKIEKIIEMGLIEQSDELEEIKSESITLKNGLTKSTKSVVFNNLILLWAKAQKAGLPVIKEILINVTSEIAKQLILGK